MPIIENSDFSFEFIDKLVEFFYCLKGVGKLANFHKIILTQILFNSKKLSENEIINYRINIKKIIEKLCFYSEINLIYLTNENFEIGEYGFKSIKNKKSIDFPNNKFLIFIECANNNVLKKHEPRGFYPKLTQQVLKIHNEVEYNKENYHYPDRVSCIISTDNIELIDPDIRAKFSRIDSPNKK